MSNFVSLGSGVYRVRLPLPFVSPRYVNAYIFETPSGLTVLDCGVNDDACHSTLLDAAAELGGDIDTVIGSHLHIDHIGMARRLVSETGARWIMHASTDSEVPRYNDWESRRGALAEAGLRNGAPQEFYDRILAEWARPDWYDDAISPSHPVNHGDTIALGNGRTLNVLHTPGHQPNHICLIDSETGALFSGDHLLPKVSPFIPYVPGADTLADYLTSIKVVRAFKPVRTHPGHGAEIGDGDLRASDLASHHEERLTLMLSLIGEQPRSAWDVMEHSFRKNLSLSGQRLAMQETLAHLTHLVSRQQSESVITDGVTYYRSTA